jgi:cell division protein FtsQ
MTRMKKKKIIRILHVMAWMAVIAGIGVSIGFVSKRQDRSLCKDMIFSIDYQGGEQFINEEELKKDIEAELGQVIGRPLEDITIERLKHAISNDHYVELAEVMMTVNGIVKVSVVQRKPFIRLFNDRHQSCYIDAVGQLIALKPDHPVRLMVVSGNIDIDLSDDALRTKNLRCRANGSAAEAELNEVFLLAREINKDDFLKAQIEQVYVNDKGEFELLPKVGHNLIVLGDTSYMQEKLNNLVLFYKNCIEQAGWDRYDTITIRFRNQVVCSKI